MKKFFIVTVTICLTAFSGLAQHDQNTHQNKPSTLTPDTNIHNNLSRILVSYYAIKDALIAGNASSASAGADLFIKAANTVDYKVISEGNINALLKDANKIASGKDINQQRETFVNFSNNMIIVAKAVKLSPEPVYQQYCPMKKAYWLSNETVIKNPYYGKQMLSCGNVSATINASPGQD